MIVVDDVAYAYGRALPPILDGLSASFPPGAVTAVTGDNGCGKTTLTKLIVGVTRPLRGRILVDGVDIAPLSLAEIGRQIGYLHQNPAHQLFCTSVAEEVAFGLRNLGLDDADVEARLQHYLDYFGLTENAADFPLHLSHGQRQRVMLAVVFSMRPAYVVLDEPTTGLDLSRRHALGTYIREIVEDEGCGVILVSHERGFIARYADQELHIDAVRGCRC